MYAVIKTGGKQYKVTSGDVVKIEKIAGYVAEAQLPSEEKKRTAVRRTGCKTTTSSMPMCYCGLATVGSITCYRNFIGR